MEKRMQAQKKSLGLIQRKAVDLSRFNPVRERQLRGDHLLPLLMEPAAEQVDLAEWAAGNREYIEQQLQRHGGILFRGFALSTPQDFERVANAIYRQIYAEYGDLPREGVAGKMMRSDSSCPGWNWTS